MNSIDWVKPVRAMHPLRQAVYNKWYEWKVPGLHADMLAQLFDYNPDTHIWREGDMTPEQDHLCGMLAGEHGLTILKMLMARKGHDHVG